MLLHTVCSSALLEFVKQNLSFYLYKTSILMAIGCYLRREGLIMAYGVYLIMHFYLFYYLFWLIVCWSWELLGFGFSVNDS